MCVHAVMGICSFFSILIVHDSFLDCADSYEPNYIAQVTIVQVPDTLRY